MYFSLCLFSFCFPLLIFGQDLDFMPVPVRPISAVNSSAGGGGEHLQLRQEPRCLESVEAGTGTDTVSRFFYQSTNSSCVPFIYTGEGGNTNNFLTELDCLNNCFIGVNDEAPQEDEEDVHLIKQDTSRLVKKNSCDTGETLNCTSMENGDEKDEILM
ncbi:hypothetical protein niasHS_003008 [Heterodera schachtii]|uniref:BPTI/Kunitz inhibitor domain-containing protein n=1 Tax=Heterodera schachtii TaxID=97005 RepID=A0ABD2K9N0_HETSC